ncbi:ATP-binding cassette domain-containing protein [Weissella confusa]|uniref:ATP-binding cassette domain-containing protein n=1 Tax=Weissella confusa TaxID=1583 RepID=UPI001F5BE592|nr:ATP-binding cassette domain-containing protein [Weissella confusa]
MQDYKQVTNEKKRLAQRAKTAGEKSNRAKKINPHKHSHAEIEAMKSGLNGVEKGFSQQKKALNSRIERLGKVEKPVDATKLKLQNPLNVRPGKPVVTALNLTVSQADNLLIENVTFKIETGHRVAIVGPNGSGKSTLIQHLLSGAPGATHADNLRVSVANQDLSQLDTTKTALQNVMMTSTESEQVARDFLGAMGIRLMQVNEMVGQMSGGERVRVALVKALLQTSELLVLDEPTNYLDIPALEALTAYLQETQQAVLFVSHDEQLVADVATDVWQIVDGHLMPQD